ncbi:hypothetical protein ARALYDRAFT_918838 [Arabidopsis lyrata subsp. lyrata]|uniref:Uncharacterized protein n=1 Tax=Arabidopsis lyrata subsp. lyrata TaxID=81972 RepID=D7MM72_ARALL|nr:hypothetical protein ARALYDRAFT_918838 [Arabidopsis lyrata subsp. lyrata]
MPELVEANLQTLSRHENVLKSLNSIRRLSLCLDVEVKLFSIDSLMWFSNTCKL